MEKKQGLAQITRVWIPEHIAESNESNERCDLQVDFSYKNKVGSADALNEMFGALDADILELASQASSGNAYHYLLDATRLGFTADNVDDALKAVKAKLENKECIFTTYVAKVSELLQGSEYYGTDSDGKRVEFSAVNNGMRSYSSFNASFLLVNDDSQGVFESLKNRILDRLNKGDYEPGRNDSETDAALWKATKKARKKSAKATDDDDDDD